LLTILDGLEGLDVVGADVGTSFVTSDFDSVLLTADKLVVEVAPVYDNAGETTVLAAAEVALSLVGLMVKKPVN
jgi:agmatinase